MLEIRLLGDPSIFSDGVAVAFRAPSKALSLLGYLTLHPGEISRTRLAFTLWPDVDEEAARTNLRRHLHLLQATLPSGVSWLHGTRRTIAWCGEQESWVDAVAFEALAASTETVPASVELYRGDLLAGLDDDWIVPLRDRLRERQTENLYSLMRRARARREFDAATDYGMQLRRIDAWREDAVRELMEIRLEAGDRAGALRVYADLAERLREELGVEPTVATSELAAWMREQSASPGVRERPRIPALPATSFHGREADVERVRASIRSGRVVTLTGPGGVGKTRLAVETAALVAAELQDGAQLADFGGVDDGALLPERLVQALGIRQPPGASALATAVTELRDRDLLIVLDNCDHVLVEAARLAQRLVREASRLRILVTSREPLGIADEIVYRVRPLPAATGTARAAEDALRSPAVQLFIDRAAARDTTRSLAPDALAVAEICDRLDGLPLAIEMAAANLGGMPIGTFAERLAERLEVAASAAPSQRRGESSLRAVFDWSYGRLSDALRALFVRLAVFRGGFSPAGAHAVAGRDTAQWMSLQLVAALAEQSLLVADDEAHEPRYRMLETTRAFARELLAGTGAASATERDHVTHFAGSAERARVDYELVADEEWLAPLNADRDNYAAALERALGDSLDPPAGATIAAGLTDYWLTAGQEATAIRWLSAAAQADPACTHALVGLASVYRRGYRFADAIGTGRLALDSLRTSQDTVALCRALTVVGNSVVSSARPGDEAAVARGRATVIEALEIAQARHHTMRIAEARFALGIIAHYTDDLATALRELEAAQEIFTSLGKRLRRENASLSIALVAYDADDLERAAEIARDLTREERGFHRVQMAHAYEILGTVALDRGDVDAAQRDLERALQLAVDTELEPIIDARVVRLARVAAASGQPEAAVCLLGYARKCEETGTLRRPPREIVIGNILSASLEKQLKEAYDCFWVKGYQATRAEAIAIALGRAMRTPTWRTENSDNSSSISTSTPASG